MLFSFSFYIGYIQNKKYLLIAALFDKNKLYCFLTDSQCSNKNDFITNNG